MTEFSTNDVVATIEHKGELFKISGFVELDFEQSWYLIEDGYIFMYTDDRTIRINYTEEFYNKHLKGLKPSVKSPFTINCEGS